MPPVESILAIGTLLMRLARRLWAALDGPDAQKVTRLAIFAIFIALGAGGWLTYGRFGDIDRNLQSVEAKVAGIPEMARRRDEQIAELHRQDERLDHELGTRDTILKAHAETMAAIASDLRGVTMAVARLAGQVDGIARLPPHAANDIDDRFRPGDRK